jgi:hypothetical protein
MKSADLPSTRSRIHHACMRCSVGLDLHACSYELASCLKGAAGSQICQSGATMPDRLAPLLATNRLVSTTVIMFALQNSTCTRSAPTQTCVTEPFLIPLSDSVSVSKHPIIPNIKSGKLPNLYFAGQLTSPGPGVPPAIISGQVVADLIRKDVAGVSTAESLAKYTLLVLGVALAIWVFWGWALT